MALDFHTQGKVQMWGGELRRVYDPAGVDKDGTNIDNVKTAWTKLGYTILDRRGKTWNDAIVDLKNGRGIILQGDYDVFTGDDSCQPTFDGDHAIYVSPEFLAASAMASADPLCPGYKRITIATLKAYAEKLGKRVYGDNRILYAATRAWPDPIVPVPAPVTGDDMPAFTAPLKPTEVQIAAGQWLYIKQDFSGDPSNVQISGDRWMPLVGKTLTASIVSYVGSDGKNTGKTYFAKPASIKAERSPVVDCSPAIATAVATATAPLKAQVTSLTADVASRDARITAMKAKTSAHDADIQND